MKKIAATKLVNEKIVELKSTIASLKTNDTLSKATRGTQLYARGKERRVLHLINSLIEQCGDELKLSEDDMNTFVLITTLASERAKPTQVEVREGDTAFALAFGKYKDVKNINEKLMKAADRAGLKLNDKGVFVKA